MKKFTTFIVLCLSTIISIAQSFNNEWIDYNKTYYKFHIGATGAYRITAAELNAVGLASQPVQNFQLWRNGKQIALYTSVATGAIGNGFIEFWGEKNDGLLDKQLYRTPALQLNDKVSIQSDTAAFFLTVNATGNNLRFAATDNSTTGNTLAPEPWFIYSARKDFMDRIHRGHASPAGGEYLYSSSYDRGEMWSTQDISPSTPLTYTFNNLFVAPVGPAASFSASLAGSAPNFRSIKIDINNTTNVIETTLAQFNATISSNTSVPLSVIATNAAAVKINNLAAQQLDRIVCGFVDLTYPRQFNFGNLSNFEFTMPASAVNKYIEVSNFNSGGSTPVLYDVTNNRRYVAEISSTGLFKFILQPSAVAANFVLVSQAIGNAKVIPATSTRNFVNYSIAANQGDYLIITHSSLQVPLNGANQVDQYRAYRASAAGGSYNAKIYEIDQLVDQFSFGIKKHPISVKNFLRFARASSIVPKFAFIIGKGLSYAEYRENHLNPAVEKLNLVPTWGFPASDVLLASSSLDPFMNTPLGRLSILHTQELADYLEKVKQYEQAQQNTNQTIDNKLWMKNAVHVVGANDPSLDFTLSAYMAGYQRILEDTLYGGKVTNFNKTSTGAVTPITNSLMEQMFQKGMSIINYFGHSSATSLDYNLDDPYAYNNTGKYPMFIVNGCNAGNLYDFDTSRFSVLSSLSERWVLAKNKGTIGFIASSHFGLPYYLDYYNQGLYRSMAVNGYGKSIGSNINDAIALMNAAFGTNNFEARIHAEQTTLNGDPSLKMNSFASPDYAVEEPQIVITPNIVSVADLKFNVRAYLYNLGKATGDSVTVQVKQQYPDGTSAMLFDKRIKSVRYIDSVSLEVPIVAIRDKGENKIIVSIDTDNKYAELSESNNSNAKSFSIFEDELKPVYPYNFAIVNRTSIKLTASTANPLAASRQYLMEIDTTEMFNSSLKVSRNVTSAGGIIEFDPGINFTDSTVYHWRVAPASAPGTLRWNTASFVYINGSSYGYNQSNFYQHTKSATTDISLDSSSRKWKYVSKLSRITITNSIYPTSGTEDNQFSVAVNGIIDIASACLGRSVIFSVFDPVTLKPLYNQAQPSTVQNGAGGGFMNSYNVVCLPTRRFNFEYSYMDTASRRRMRDFLDWVPSGYYVTVRLNLDAPFEETPFVNTWKNDALVYGAGNTLYDRFKTHGFSNIDSFTYARTFAFVFQKNNPAFPTASKLSSGLFDRISVNSDISVPSTTGFITSPTFGPAKAWKQVKWRGSSLETTPGDVPVVNVIGITPTGIEDTLYRLNTTQQDFDISTVNPIQYPYIRLRLRNQDSVSLTPYQLRYWRLLYDPVPEGALAPNITFSAKDTLEQGEKLNFSIAFKNISDVAFADSLKVRLVLFDKNNVANVINVPNRKRLQPGDTTTITTEIDTKAFGGNNTLYVDVNPDFAQPEQYRFNNFLYKNFNVKGDAYNPLMDVTFDGVHILNGDIVSAKPKILIKLKDEAKFLALDDTSLVTVFVRYPGTNGQLKRFAFGTDTLRFTPANLSTGKNEAMVEFSPAFLADSDNDFYELVVRAKDKSGNAAGSIDYNVRFQVINKPMISNMFNYPNPFTTSTAFVFTITGVDVPQNIRIQVLTVTGKIVRDITKDELGPLHVGRNITEFKWDGTDQYGQKLGNGIYLYRVITNQNGNSLEKYNTTIIEANGNKVNTDKYFNKGYGKMYLMR